LKIFVVNGYPNAGKDTFIDMCLEELRPSTAVKASSVDVVKQAAKMLGWDGVKDDRGRMFLSDLKDLSTAAYDGPMRCMRYVVQVSREAQVVALFLLIREPEEIARFVAEFPGTKTILVERGSEAEHLNHADAGVAGYPYDVTIQNDKDLANLRFRVKKFLKSEMRPALVALEAKA